MTEPAELKDLLTREEVAAQLRVHPLTVGVWLRSGQLRGWKVGRQWRISIQDVLDFLQGEAKARR